MVTYTPFEKSSPASSPACHLRGNRLQGAIGPVNVGETERYGSIAGGVALIAAALSRRGLPGVLLAILGAAFIARGASGHCRLYHYAGVSTAAG